MASDHRQSQEPGDEKNHRGDLSLELDVTARMPVKEEDEGEDNENYLEKVFRVKLLEMPIIEAAEILFWLAEELV